jgi:cytochrome subunit of sulfide dehydrogenase
MPAVSAGIFSVPAWQPSNEFAQGETMRTTSKIAAVAMLAMLAGAVHGQQTEADARAARYLASNCANCHGTSGTAQGAMPSLAGQQKTYMVEQMRAFRDGKRPATIMHQLAKGYTDQQIELIADHFSRQKPAR